MDTLTRLIGETLVVRGVTAAVARWGFLRVAGGVGAAALAAYYLSSRSRAGQGLLQLAQPLSVQQDGWPDQDRRRAPELEPGTTYPGERRTLH
jgi:hypothetical protein